VTLGTTLAVVPLTWLLLGWRWPRSVSGHDGLANLLVLLQTLVQARGDWSRLAYRADLLGGMVVRDAVGPFPVFSGLARLGFSPTAILDLTTFLLQSVVAFLGLRAAADLATSWSGAEARLGGWLRLAGAWACGFAPVLGWKIGAGHQTLLTGMLPFLAAFALIAAAGAGTATAALVVVAGAALAGGVLFTGHQMVVYGIIFGGPILFGAWWALGRRGGDLRLPAGVAAGSAILVLPDLWGVLAHAFGTDSLRAVHGMRITYSYLTGHPLDWLGSLLWARDALRPSQPPLLHHEINNPMGPMLLLLFLVPWSRARALAKGLVVSIVLALLFSMNAHPVSDALLLLLPPLGSFRVPTRAIQPALFLLPVLALAGVLREAGRPRGRRALVLAVAAAAVIFRVPPLARELLGWALAAAVVFRPARLGRLAAVPAGAAFLVLAAGGLAAFEERVSSFGPFPDGDALLARAHALDAAARSQQDELGSPLVRVNASFEWPEFLANTAVAAGLSSLEGYYFPQRRLVELMCATRGQPYQPNSLILRFPPEWPSSRALFQLYDVWWRLDAQGGISPLVETAGPAWFAHGFARVGSIAELGPRLVARADDLATDASRTLWLVSSDPVVARSALPDAVDDRCIDAQVLEIVAPRGTPGVGARVSAPADCPLTFAMNYAENLRATALFGADRRQPATVFPAYGALAGVWVPRGATAVRVEAVVRRPPAPLVWRGLGAVVLLAQAMYIPRRRRP